MAEVSVPLESMGLSNEELFSGALGSETAQEKPQETVQAEPEQKADPTERARDESGRFAKAEVEKPAQEQPQAVTEQPKADAKPETEVPSWRLRELREARDSEAKLRQDAEARASQFEAQLRQLMANQHQQQTPAPDIFQNPEQWQQHNAQQFKADVDRVRFDMSEDAARDKYGDEKVNAALKWAGNLNPAERAQLNSARSPYRELVRIYDERQTLSQIGGDLTAYHAKYEEQLLSNPAFMQKVADKLRGQAPANQRPPTQLPPSLNKAMGSGNSSDLTSADMSNEALFGHATAR